jgi:hypothetical protein
MVGYFKENRNQSTLPTLYYKPFFSSSDMWGLGCLVWEVFNGPMKSRTNLKDIESVSSRN